MTTGLPRRTRQTRAVTAALLLAHPRPLRSKEIGTTTGLAAGTVMPILARLAAAGLAERITHDRARRYHWRLTTEGTRWAMGVSEKRMSRRRPPV